MSAFKNLTRKFARMLGLSTEAVKPVIPVIVEDEKSKSEWVVLATDATVEDVVAINPPETIAPTVSDVTSDDDVTSEFEVVSNAEESPIDIGNACELLAKAEAYKLAVPVDINTDTAAASKHRLAEQGYSLEQLGTDGLRDKGIYINALVKDGDPNAPITILCRGTQGDASIFADLDPSSPGNSLINEHSSAILEQLNSLCEKYPGRKIRLTGHSLGGALSQVLTDRILAVKAEAAMAEYQYLKNIPGIDIAVFQSAGVSKSVVERVQKNAELAKAADENFAIKFIAHVKDGDFVSRTGAHIFSNVGPELADVSLVKLNLGKPCVTLGDAFDIGFAAITSFNPIWLGIKSMVTLAKRYILNRMDAHKDYFYHNREDKTEKYFAYGIYSNSIPEDRKIISDVLSEDIVSAIPGARAIQQYVFGLTDGIDNDEMRGLIAGAGAILPAVRTIADLAIASGSSPKLVAAAARHISDAKVVADMCFTNGERSHRKDRQSALSYVAGIVPDSHVARAGRAILKMFNNFRGRKAEQPTLDSQSTLLVEANSSPKAALK